MKRALASNTIPEQRAPDSPEGIHGAMYMLGELIESIRITLFIGSLFLDDFRRGPEVPEVLLLGALLDSDFAFSGSWL
jgi:hypothetical protein